MIDTLIIGAGPSGLCAAKTFLQYDHQADIVIVDAHETLGGVWSKEQLYPTLKTNNLLSGPDFIDFPMDSRFGIEPGQHITGEAMHAYLVAYAQHFELTSRIRFKTYVVQVSKRDEGHGWHVHVDVAGQRQVLSCNKLAVATGVLSVPHLPDLKGAHDFQAPYIHSSQLGPECETLMKNPGIQTIAVLGGCKSAYDAVHLAASTGHKVEWIIRKSGRGPTWVFPPHTFLGPIKVWRERLVTRRFLSFMSPCIFPDFSGLSWLRNFLHFNSIGKFISQKFWAAIHADTIHDCAYRTDPKLGVLEPEQNPFW
jgi:cation diffusion facilitator CzcD-associated flavoprotein CzcO